MSKEIQKLSQEQYRNLVSEETREKLYIATCLANTIYTLFFDIHNDLRKQKAFLDKKLIHNYSRLPKLCNQLQGVMLRLGYTKGTEDKAVDQILSIADDIYEPFVNLFIDRLTSNITEDLNNLMELFEYLKKLPTHNIIKNIDDPNWEDLINNFEIKEENG